MSVNNYHFQKLTPTTNANIDVYESAINFVFDKKDIKNVAISGAYSSGKSSLIESYKVKYPQKQFIHLSLAHFRTPEQEENAESGDSKDNGEIGKVKESLLEGKILNQLIHQIPADKIPQTNFRVKKSVDKKSTDRISLLSTLIVISVLFIIFYNNMIAHINALPTLWVKNLTAFFVNPYSAIIVTVILGVCSIIATCNLVKIQKNKNIFHKISLQGNEIEIFEKQDESYFDKYLNEVLYLFENVEADVIVFEDMDRFNASKIFERLREVNTLINIHRKKQQKDKYIPLRFFYLIRDDIFISKDRTKFFDYIVPVVPIVDSSNSYEQFIKHLTKGGLVEKFNQSFLQGLSLYIDDMRILKNIYNEFVVYFNRLNTTELDCDKMLAIIAYKNIFPRDFSDLQLKQGYVYEIFAQKNNFVNTGLTLLESEKTKLEERIQNANKEHLENDEEIEAAYREKENQMRYWGYNEREEKRRKYEIEKVIRKQAIQDKNDNTISLLEQKLTELELDIQKYRTSQLKDIITRENIDSIFSVTFKNEVNEIDEFIEIRGSEYFQLLKYLIRNGFIDETYSDYMTYFYEGSISANDKIFLRRITDKRGAEYTYELKDPIKVISSALLRQVDFNEEEVLNFDLLQCLLENHLNDKYNNYIKTLILQLSQSGKFDFVSQYYRKDISHEIFIIKVNEYWNSFFCTVLKNNKIPKEQVRKYSIETLYYSDDEIIKMVNIDECLKEYISECDDYLQIKEPNVPKLITKFKLLNVQFVSLNYDLSDKNLFERVYQENFYAINFTNLKLMLHKKYNIDNEDDIAHKNYSLIQSNASSPLAKYIANNLSEYIEVVLRSCDREICDELSDVTYLLNCDSLEHQQKEDYISVLSTMLKDIASISDTTLWHLLLIKGLIVFDESNVLQYYNQFGLTGELIDFINASDQSLNFTNTKNVFGKETSENFFATVLKNNDIDTDKYEKILIDLGYYYNIFTSKNIDDAKMTVLVTRKIIRMTVENLSYLREHYSDHISRFVEMNLEEYLELQTTEIFDFNEAMRVIKLKFEVGKKIGLITLTSDPISILDKGYEDELCAHILSNNLNSEDLCSLYKNYSLYQNLTKLKIFNLAINNISDIANVPSKVDGLLLTLLFEASNVNFSYKTMIFDNLLTVLNEDECCEIFDKIGVEELKAIFTQGSGKRKYNVTSEVTMVLDILRKHNWIFEYQIDEQKPNKCTIIKNKPKQKNTFID